MPLVALRIPEWALDADIDPELLRKIAHGEPEDGEEAVVAEEFLRLPEVAEGLDGRLPVAEFRAH